MDKEQMEGGEKDKNENKWSEGDEMQKGRRSGKVEREKEEEERQKGRRRGYVVKERRFEMVERGMEGTGRTRGEVQLEGRREVGKFYNYRKQKFCVHKQIFTQTATLD